MNVYEISLFDLSHLKRYVRFKPLSLIAFPSESCVAILVRVFARDEAAQHRQRHFPCRLSTGTPSLFIRGA